PAVFDQVGGIGATQRVQIQSGGQFQIVAVAAESSKQGVLGHQRAFLTGEQVNSVVEVPPAMRQPVGEYVRCPVEYGQCAAPLGWGSLFGLAVADVNHTVAAEFGCVWVAGKVNSLQV